MMIMESNMQTNAYQQSHNKSSLPFILMTVAVILSFCIAVASMAAAVVLFIGNNELKEDIKALKSQADDFSEGMRGQDKTVRTMSTQVSANKAEIDVKLATLRDTDLKAIKGDVATLQDKTKDIHPDFKLSSLKLTFDDSYTYSDYYDGVASVTCSDKASKYLVLIKSILKSGGTPGVDREYTVYATVVNGTGKFYTQDSNEKGKLVKPVYSFEIIGFSRLVDWEQ